MTRSHARLAASMPSGPSMPSAAMARPRGDPGRSLRILIAEIRIQAARSSGIRKDVKAVPALLPLLKDADPAVRREAAIAIGKIGDQVGRAPP